MCGLVEIVERISCMRIEGLDFDIFMRAMIFLIFECFDSVPKALDSQAQGLKVPASTGGCSGKVFRDTDAADVQH